MPIVMLVEDDETMLSLVQTLLEMEGFTVVHRAPDAGLEEVAAALRDEKPELALLDVHLRDFSGLDLLHHIRHEPGLSTVKVLMSSGMDVGQQCLNAGADDFIMKPYMPEELLNKIRELI